MNVKYIFICICLISFLSFLSEDSYAERDWEYWPGSKFKLKVKENIDFTFLQEFRMKNDMGNFYTYVAYIGPTLKLNNYMDASFWYKPVLKKKKGDWDDSHRLDGDLTLKTDLAGFNLANRSRFEYNLTTSGWLYRDRIKIARSIDTPIGKIKPYAQNEFFFAIEPSDDYNENRASFGIGTKFIKNSDLSIYYMLRSKKKSDWHHTNVLGSFITLKF